MWHTLHVSREANSDFLTSVTELLQSTSRNLILATGGIYLTWALLATEELPVELILSFLPVTAIVVLTCALSLWLIPKSLLATQAIWQAGLIVAITLAVHVSQRPEVAFLYALLPFMAVVTVGWPAGMVVEGLVIVLVWWLTRGGAMPRIFTAYGIAIPYCHSVVSVQLHPGRGEDGGSP